jgi:hypothetical protein
MITYAFQVHAVMGSTFMLLHSCHQKLEAIWGRSSGAWVHYDTQISNCQYQERSAAISHQQPSGNIIQQQSSATWATQICSGKRTAFAVHVEHE